MPTLSMLSLLLLLTASPLPDAGDPAAAPPKVCIQPLGKYSRYHLGKAVLGIKALYNLPVKVLPQTDMPSQAWYAPRKRFRADKLLDFLHDEVLPGSGCDMVVGFTRHDISVTKGKHKDWGIFGLGGSYLSSCVVSTHRLGRRGATKREVAIRTIKVVNHELGHVLGLGHCPKVHCLMEDAKGTIRTVDGESGLLCDLCKGEVERRHGLQLPDLREMDWDALLKE